MKLLDAIFLLIFINLVAQAEDQCDPPVPPEHCTVNIFEDEISVGSIVTYTCDEGRTLAGSASSRCLKTGEWTSSPPRCLASCPILTETEDMSVSYSNGLVEGSRAAFHCLLPRIRTGVLTTKCLPNGKWANSPARCILPGCLLLQLFDVLPESVIPDLGNVTDILPNNYTLSLTCDNNLILIGSNTAKCGWDGTWQVSKIRCVRGCDSPKTENSEIIIDPDKQFYRVGELVTLSCSSGYVLSSDTFRLMCLGNFWSEVVMPECVEED